MIGGVVRRVTGAARDLDADHRRDGLGLTLIGLSVVVAASVWWRLPGGVGETTRTVVNGSVGLLGWFVPLALLAVGVVTMRNPETSGPAGRQVIGWSALLFGVLGLIHISHGSPRGTQTQALHEAGGAVGFVVGSLSTDLLRSTLVAVPLLVLMALFGLLVVTATPVYRIPERFAAARDLMLGRRHTRRRSRRSRGPRARAAHAPQSLPPPPGLDDRRRLHPRGRPRLRQPGRRGARPLDRTPQAWPVDHERRLGRGRRRARRGGGRDGRPGRERHRRCRRAARAAAAHAAPGPRRAARAVRRHRLLAARQRGPQARQRAQGQVQGLRRRRGTAHRGARAVRHRRPGHRLHPRTDRHPLRGRARPRGQGREGDRAGQEHRLRRRLGRRAHPESHPGQERHRHRDPQRRQGDRLPR